MQVPVNKKFNIAVQVQTGPVAAVSGKPTLGAPGVRTKVLPGCRREFLVGRRPPSHSHDASEGDAG
jgi:hypothetical protein